MKITDLISTASIDLNVKAKNKEEFNGSRDELIAEGYEPCGSCRP